jgi:hypothetical protein
MKHSYFYIILTILTLQFNISKAQNTIVNSEVGVFLGPSYFQGDFGESNNFKSSTSNVGMGFEFTYILDFSDSRYRSKFFNTVTDHIKQRLQLSYTRIKIKHEPIPVPESSTQYNSFKSMFSETKVFSIGTAAEINIFSITKKPYKFEPYINWGVSYNIVSPNVSSSTTLPTIYTTGEQKIFNEKQKAISFIVGAGTRYRLNNVDLVFEGNINSFLSDKIEGLDPNFSSDKNNDSMVSFRFGAIFHINSRK